MNKFLMRLAINAIALYAAVKIVPGITAQNMNWLAFLGLALIFGLLNALLRPLLKLLTCPLIILTLGLFTLLINTFLFYLAGNLGTSFGIGFTVSGFWAAFFGALITSIVSIALSLLLKDERKKKRS
ncbi:MAG: phage holin family protein [Anaerolineales bacterium]|nr:phage holin family protein [Anaerolineales bacterium]